MKRFKGNNIVKLSIHTRHDANITIFDLDGIKEYFEIEKITDKRYFSFKTDYNEFRKEFERHILPLISVYEISEIITCWLTNDQIRVLKDIFGPDVEFKSAHHHLCHVYSAYMFTQPREDDLVLSIDGGGDLDDYFYTYRWCQNKLHELSEIKINLGKAYRIIGLLSPELHKRQELGYIMDQALSGKKMSLQSYGKVRDEFIKPVEQYYINFMEDYDAKNDRVEKNLSILLNNIGFYGERFLDTENARDILATSQYVFEKILKQFLYPILQTGFYKRLIVVGGCALNVKFNSLVNDELGIEVFTPPCANDSGISLGAARMLYPILSNHILDTPFTRTKMRNYETAAAMFDSAYAKQVHNLTSIASLIAKGNVIATAVGDIEIGPRALGNRSYLASPFIKGMKDKINAPDMKDREIWRPVAPIVLAEDLNIYFDTILPSPYMTFAPQIKPEYRELLKEIMHIDGSARVQTVERGTWMYDLLTEFKNITGHGIIMNTSFNVKGHPLINDLSEAFDIFQNSKLDGIIFSKKNLTKNSRFYLYTK